MFKFKGRVIWPSPSSLRVNKFQNVKGHPQIYQVHEFIKGLGRRENWSPQYLEVGGEGEGGDISMSMLSLQCSQEFTGTGLRPRGLELQLTCIARGEELTPGCRRCRRRCRAPLVWYRGRCRAGHRSSSSLSRLGTGGPWGSHYYTLLYSVQCTLHNSTVQYSVWFGSVSGDLVLFGIP